MDFARKVLYGLDAFKEWITQTFAVREHGTHVSTSTCVTSVNGSKGDVTIQTGGGVTGIRLGSPSGTLQTGEVAVTPSSIGAQVAGSYAAASHGTHVSSSTCVTGIAVNNGSTQTGNVSLTIPQGTVKSVNSVGPNSSGNVTLSFFGLPNYNAKIAVGNVSSYKATVPGIVFFRLGLNPNADVKASINGTVLFVVGRNDTNTRRYWAILDKDDELKNESNGNLLDVNFFPFK